LRFRGRKKNVLLTPAGSTSIRKTWKRASQTNGVMDSVVIPVERGGNAEPCAVLLVKNSDRTSLVQPSRRPTLSCELSANSDLDRLADFDIPRNPPETTPSVISSRATQILDGRQVGAPESAGADFSPASSPQGAIDELVERLRSEKAETCKPASLKSN